MNGALLIVLVLSLAGLLPAPGPGGERKTAFRARAAAWLLVGLAGMALLSPTLLEPGAVPSPAATLGHFPPWQGDLDPSAGNPNLRDVTHQIQPWLLHLRGELRAGRMPFWNPHQFAGAPFWSNGQSAPLFPLHLLFAALPLELGLVLLPWLKLLIAGLGTWRLARELGIGPPGAAAAAVTFPLSGMVVSFLLYPMGNALALVPWVLWGTERVARGGGAVPLAVALGLQMLSGHPETPLHTCLVAGLYLLIRGPETAMSWPRYLSWRGPLGRFAAAGLTAAALAAVQLLPLYLHLQGTTKWAAHEALRPPVGLVLKEMLRVVLPELYGHPARGTWFGPVDYASTAVYVGAAALPLAAAGLALARRDRRWRGLAGILAFSFLVAYHLPGLWDLLVSLPVWSRVLHHRLIFVLELVLALGLGAGWERWRRGEGRRAVWAGSALAVLLVAAAWAMLAGQWATREMLAERLAQSLLVLGATAMFSLRWLPALRRLRLPLSPRPASLLPWLLPLLMMVDLVAAHRAVIPALPLADLYPRTPAVDFLHHRPGRLAGLGGSLHPNAAMVYDLYDLRGDDPVKARRFEEIYGRLAAEDPYYFRPVERWGRGELLDALGVRWVMGRPGVSPPPAAARDPVPWRLAYDGPDARVWERPGALPLVRWQQGEDPLAAAPRLELREPGLWRLRLEPAAEGTPPRELVVAEIWHPGWSAGGEPGDALEPGGLEIEASEDGLLRISIPAGVERVALSYRPPGLAAGALLGALGLLGLVGLAWLDRRSLDPAARGLP